MNREIRKIIFIVMISMISAIAGVISYKSFENKTQGYLVKETIPSKFANYIPRGNASAIDFTGAASITTPAVVHIQTVYKPKHSNEYRYKQVPDPLKEFFGEDYWDRLGVNPYNQQPQRSFGSGVIISGDGYIVTNNHVIENGDEFIVTLHDKREYNAKLIGKDPSTDIALIKIEETQLPTITFGNSDTLLIGEWVLAVGNPFNLSSTVTAGIVSAKGRDIQLLHDQYPIESFIQTDAAVNQGNSGGALVNLKGELIGINTAIAAPTGTYAGYAFAVPVNIVKKVVNDLSEFGIVQRGFLGISLKNINKQLADEINKKIMAGVYVDSVFSESSAKEGGIKHGDIIVKINGVPVNSVAELREQVSLYRPGNKIKISFMRDDKEIVSEVTLKNKNKNTGIVKIEEQEIGTLLGADFNKLNDADKKKYNIKDGIRVTKIRDGKLRQQTDIREGFIITRIDGKEVEDLEDLEEVIRKKQRGIMIEGVYPGRPGVFYYCLDCN